MRSETSAKACVGAGSAKAVTTVGKYPFVLREGDCEDEEIEQCKMD